MNTSREDRSQPPLAAAEAVGEPEQRRSRALLSVLEDLQAERQRLAAEIDERKRLEVDLRKAQQDLETRVEERTADLRAERRAALNIAQDADEARRRAEQAEAELKREQFLLNALVENIPDPVFFKGRDGRFLRVNQVMALDAGVSGPDELIGKSDADIWPAEFVKETAGDEKAIMETGQPLINKEENPVNKEGLSRWVLVTKMPLRDESGEIVGTFGIARDVTERKKRQQEIEHLNEALERSNSELEQFAYIASHDLQEPLRKIQAFGNLLTSKHGQVLGAEGQDYVQRMQRAAERMQTLINDLLSYSRVTTKGRDFERVDLSAIARSVIGDLEARLQQTGGRVEIGALPIVEADATQMRQLLQNLIGNALKYHKPDETPLVQVASRAPDNGRPGVAPQQTRCEIIVQDNGIGFDEKYLDRIFAPFERLHGRGEYEGTGIGLAICKKIVQRHGGEITARSRPGQGATFVVTLPLRQLRTGETPQD